MFIMCRFRETLVIVLSLLAASNLQAADYLFNNGNTAYRIVLSSDASVTEQTAATELADYLGRISGAHFTVSTTPGNRNVFVGYNATASPFKGQNRFEDNDESFRVLKSGHDLIIYGGRERGSMCGVYRFLENQLGVRWYTPQFTLVPSQKKFVLDELDYTERPQIAWRYTDFFCVQDNAWLAHNLMDTRDSYASKNAYGIAACYLGTHTMQRFLPAEKYFDEHPEYFAKVKGIRRRSGQPCLTNANVFDIVKKGLFNYIESNPSFLIYDVSQLDNQQYCSCRKCKRLARRYGGQSGLMIWFVNKIAREVKKKYPDKLVGTFAYQYTRHAPTGIKPADNVVIRLCDIECCFTHPIADGCRESNEAFLKDLKEWTELTDKVFIWDYIVNYRNNMGPFPNIHVLGPNLKLFSDNHVIGVFEEAQGGTYGNAFEEMKSWVLAKLMWNSDVDTDSLVSQFIKDFYGIASADILAYYNLCKDFVTTRNVHMGCFSVLQQGPFTEDFLKDGYAILEQAEHHAVDTETMEKVKKVKLQLYSLESDMNPVNHYQEGRWQEFKALMLKYKSYYKTRTPPEMYIQQFENKINKK